MDEDVRTMEIERVMRRTEVRHGVPALLSFFIPGLGQMIKGQFLVGVLIWVIMGICALSCIWMIGFALTPLFWIIQVWDAYTKPDADTQRELDRLKAQRPPSS